MPVWLREKLFLRFQLSRGLKQLKSGKVPQLFFAEHHLSHAASAFYPSPFEHAAVLTVDGVGEWTTAAIFTGSGRKLTLHREIRFPHSLGLLYSAFTYFLGFKVNSGEYKLMGLAPYGNANVARVAEFVYKIKSNLVKVFDDGSFWLNMRYFRYAVALRMIEEKRWRTLFGFGRRMESDELEQHHCDLAVAIQMVTEEILMKLSATATTLAGTQRLCLAGGVALNAVANGILNRKGYDLFVQPAAGDAGGSLGAALALRHLHFNKEREVEKPDGMQGSLLGTAITDEETETLITATGAQAVRKDWKELYALVANEIAAGKIVGWVQGRMEFGPRALGARSILANAADPKVQSRLNQQVKWRENFRPFAPAMLLEQASEVFTESGRSDYMLKVSALREEWRHAVPESYNEMNWRQKLETPRSKWQAVTHVDFSARLQTVDEHAEPHFKMLLMAMKQLTGFGMVLNTSFNVRGEPIVCSAMDAYRCFLATDMDLLVMGSYLFHRSNQPAALLQKFSSEQRNKFGDD
jgi:carbamoyltransferase